MSNCASGVIEDGCAHKTSASQGSMPDQDNAICTSDGKLHGTTPEEESAHIFQQKMTDLPRRFRDACGFS